MAGLRFLTCRPETVTDRVIPRVEALTDAAKTGDEEALRRLLREPDVQLDVTNSTGMTALGYAAQNGHAHITRLLVERGAKVNQADFYGLTALQYAAEFGHVTVMKMLISHDANVDWMDINDDGLSAIHIAACKGQTEAARILINAGCNAEAQDYNGVSVLHCAVANGHRQIVQLLLSAGVKVNTVGSVTARTPLYLAIDIRDRQMVELLLEHKAKTSVHDRFGLTPLCIACLHDKEGIVVSLLDSGAKVNLQDRDRNLPLHFTARSGNLQLCRTLLQKGSKFDVLNKHSETPLHNAVRMGHVEVIRELVEAGCNVNLCEGPYSISALHVAVDTHCNPKLLQAILELLIQGGCDLNHRTCPTQDTPLSRVLDQNNVANALLLLQHGADPNEECPHEVTVLHKTCRKELYEVIDVLLHTNIDWSKETWLDIDKHTCGINPMLLGDYEDNVPLSLHGKLDLLFAIQAMHHNPPSLMRLCRRVVRSQLRNRLHIKLQTLKLPKRLEDFIMLRIT